MTICLTKDPIEYASLVEQVRHQASGAIVLFLGTVREMSEGREVSGLTYDAYPEMAERKLSEITKSTTSLVSRQCRSHSPLRETRTRRHRHRRCGFLAHRAKSQRPLGG